MREFRSFSPLTISCFPASYRLPPNTLTNLPRPSSATCNSSAYLGGRAAWKWSVREPYRNFAPTRSCKSLPRIMIGSRVSLEPLSSKEPN
jgi:hypothetical protein